VSAVLYIISIFVISNLTPDIFMDSKAKDWVDYFVLLVLIVSWIRFFSFFLVIRDVSKLLLTLMAMITDTLAFILIVACFLIIMSSVFTTLYQDYNTDKYGDLSTTFRTLFDTAIAVYDYENMGSRDLSHSILLIFVAFFTNILLLNFIIAILSTTYENMKESGIFRYKSNLFKYCERYLIAFRSEYQELVLQPAPLCYFSLILVPFTPSASKTAKAGKKFSYFMYWIENVVFLVLFLFLEFVMTPVMFCKNYYHIWSSSQTLLPKIFISVSWTLAGPVFIVIYIAQDMKVMFNILKMTEGCQRFVKDNYEDTNVEKEEKIFNQLRSVMISIYKQKKEEISKENGEEASEIFQSLHKSNTVLK
jgi:hypothetical protein